MTREQFKAARETLGLRQSDIDNAMGLAGGYCGKIERGDKPIRRLHAMAMWALQNGHRPQPTP